MSITRKLVLVGVLVSFAMSPAVAESHLVPGSGLQWYRGVTHFHTLWSDGDCAPEVAIRWYVDHGYDFVSLTDHNILATGERWVPVEDTTDAKLTPARVAELQKTFGEDWVELRTQDGRQEMRLKNIHDLEKAFATPGSFLMIPGEEVTAKMAVHINAINIKDTIEPAEAENPEDTLYSNYAAIEAHIAEHKLNTLVHINHPNFSSHITAEEIVTLGGERFFEVYNGHGSVKNWGDTERHIVDTDRLWDIILSLRFKEGDTDKPMYAVATDDAHDWFYQGAGESIPGRGWIVVLANELSADSLITAIKEGKSYSLSGVFLDEFHATDAALTVHIRPEDGVTYTTQFIGTPQGADLSSEPIHDANGREIRATRQYNEAIGKVLLETTENPASYPITGDEMYVRVKVISSKIKVNPFQEGDHEMAWTQPVRVP